MNEKHNQLHFYLCRWTWEVTNGCSTVSPTATRNDTACVYVMTSTDSSGNRPMGAQRRGNTSLHSTPSATCSRGNGTRSLRHVHPTSRTQQCVTACDTCTCTGSPHPFSRPSATERPARKYRRSLSNSWSVCGRWTRSWDCKRPMSGCLFSLARLCTSLEWELLSVCHEITCCGVSVWM